MRQETKYNKIVNIAEDGEITVLDGVFTYYFPTIEFASETKTAMKGATGSTFYPITEDDIQERIGEYEDDNMEFLKYLADSFGSITSEMIDRVDTTREVLIEHFFDTSYDEELGDYLREALGRDDIVLFECTGGGRCFNKDYQGNTNPELSIIIREFES